MEGHNQIVTDPGWIKGTKSAYDKYGAYLWLLQNQLGFQTSTSTVYAISNYTFQISNVLVGTIGDYAPAQQVSLTWPKMDETNVTCPSLTSDMPGGDSSETVKFNYDLRAYYEIRMIKVISVAIAKKEVDDWNPILWHQVILDGDDLKVKITITPGVNSLSDFITACSPVAQLHTYSINNSGAKTVIVTANIPITTANSTLQGTDEIRLTIPAADVRNLELVSKADDSIDEKCSADNETATSGLSSRRDSDGFDANAQGTQRGLARGTGNIAAIPPEGAFDQDFIKAAGVLLVDVTVCSVTGEKRQIQEQSDVFYYSGHGSHSDGSLQYATAAGVGPYWDDIDKFIVAGCAVLDINDYNNHYPGAAHTNSPGLLWIQTGPDVLIGYNWYSPADGACYDDNFTRDIIVGYLTSSETGDVNKWMWANRDKAVAVGAAYNDDAPGQRPWNACLLTRGTTEWIYWYWDINDLGDDGKPVLAHKHQSEW